MNAENNIAKPDCRLRLVVLFVSVAVFLASCLLPALTAVGEFSQIGEEEGRLADPLPGWFVLFYGWVFLWAPVVVGKFTLQILLGFAWFANLLLFGGWLSLFIGQIKKAILLSGLATLAGLLVLVPEVGFVLLEGYILWELSFVVLFLGSIACWFRSRKSLPNPG